MENHTLNLTQLETTVLENIINGLYAEAGFTDVDVNDIKDQTGIDNKILRGVLSSLIKKQIIEIEPTNTYGAPEYQLIHLRKDYWYLHPEWKNEI